MKKIDRYKYDRLKKAGKKVKRTKKTFWQMEVR